MRKIQGSNGEGQTVVSVEKIVHSETDVHGNGFSRTFFNTLGKAQSREWVMCDLLRTFLCLTTVETSRRSWTVTYKPI